MSHGCIRGSFVNSLGNACWLAHGRPRGSRPPSKEEIVKNEGRKESRTKEISVWLWTSYFNVVETSVHFQTVSEWQGRDREIDIHFGKGLVETDGELAVILGSNHPVLYLNKSEESWKPKGITPGSWKGMLEEGAVLWNWRKCSSLRTGLWYSLEAMDKGKVVHRGHMLANKVRWSSMIGLEVSECHFRIEYLYLPVISRYEVKRQERLVSGVLCRSS